MSDHKKPGKPPAGNKRSAQSGHTGGRAAQGEMPMTPPSATATVSKPTDAPTTNGSGAHAPNPALNPAEVQKKLAEAQAAARSAEPTEAEKAAMKAASAGFNTATALGHAVWLHLNTPAFRHIFLTDLEWMVLPAILFNQYRVLFDQGKPVAFSAWAYLSEEAEARLMQGNVRLAPNDWKSGDRLWLVSIVAPFGHTDKALEDVRKAALAGKTFKFHRRTPDGKMIVETVQG